MPNAISVVVLGRSLTRQERVLLRSASHNLSVVAIVAELPNAPQVLEEMNRLRPQVALVLLNGDAHHSFQLVQRIRQELPATVIICSSENHSPDLILESLRSGAIDPTRWITTRTDPAGYAQAVGEWVRDPRHLVKAILEWPDDASVHAKRPERRVTA